jgi:hypothetical protein
MRLRFAPRLVAALLSLGGCVSAAEAAEEPSTGVQAVDEETPRSKAPEPRPYEPPPPPPPRREEIVAPARARHTAIYWIFGVGTPEGITGFEGVHRFGEWFELAAGFGQGLAAESAQPHGSFGHALQWSVMPRLHLGTAHNAFTFGAGLSGGQYTDQGLCFGCDDGASSNTTYPTYYTLWENVELGGEHWNRGGFAVRYYLGLAFGEVPGAHSSPTMSTTALPYIGFGIGYAF